MARTDPVFNLRMPLDMKDELAERAKRNGRSLNAEILQILEDSIAAEKTGFPAGDARELRRVIQMQNELIDGQKEMVSKLAETFSIAISKISNLQSKKGKLKRLQKTKSPPEWAICNIYHRGYCVAAVSAASSPANGSAPSSSGSRCQRSSMSLIVAFAPWELNTDVAICAA